MPTTLTCGRCSVKFSAGTYHYHGYASGYCARTLLVCAACGTQHALEVALPDTWPEAVHFRDVVLREVPEHARIEALKLVRASLGCTPTEAKKALSKLPLVLARQQSPHELEQWKREHECSEVGVDFPVTHAFRDMAPTRPDRDRLLTADKPLEGDEQLVLEEVRESSMALTGKRLNLALQSCVHCAKTGTLRAEYATHSPCPRCGALTLEETSAWIT